MQLNEESGKDEVYENFKTLTDFVSENYDALELGYVRMGGDSRFDLLGRRYFTIKERGFAFDYCRGGIKIDSHGTLPRFHDNRKLITDEYTELVVNQINKLIQSYNNDRQAKYNVVINKTSETL